MSNTATSLLHCSKATRAIAQYLQHQILEMIIHIYQSMNGNIKQCHSIKCLSVLGNLILDYSAFPYIQIMLPSHPHTNTHIHNKNILKVYLVIMAHRTLVKKNKIGPSYPIFTALALGFIPKIFWRNNKTKRVQQ